jgi:hypothetical protein
VAPAVIGVSAIITGVLYMGTVALLAITATYAKRPSRRREARATLAILVRQQYQAAAESGNERQ